MRTCAFHCAGCRPRRSRTRETSCGTGDIRTGRLSSPRAPKRRGPGGPPPFRACVCELLRCDHLEGDRRRELVAQSNGRLVLAHRLDRGRDLDLALVDLAEAGVGDCSRDIRRLFLNDTATTEAGLDGQLDLGRLELGLERLGVVERVELPRGAGRLDRVDLLLAAA